MICSPVDHGRVRAKCEGIDQFLREVLQKFGTKRLAGGRSNGPSGRNFVLHRF